MHRGLWAEISTYRITQNYATYFFISNFHKTASRHFANFGE
jgi:hypothetical protein